MSRLTDVTITINLDDYRITKRKLKPKSVYYIKGVGIDLKEYKTLTQQKILEKKKELGLETDDFIIIMIAELNKNKNHMQLIKALDILNKKYKNIKALCVGDGIKLQELKEEVRNRGLEKNIIFLGFRNDINELINIGDIGILLSYREGLPRNILEFMANGKKVIATDIRGNRDLICNSDLGTLVKINDYEETALAIEFYYKYKISHDKLNLIGEYNILKETENYEVKKICNELIKIYDSLSLCE